MISTERRNPIAESIRRRWFTALAVCITLTPTIYIAQFPGIRAEQILVILAALAAFWAYLGGTPLPIPRSLFAAMLAGFSLCMLVSIANGYRTGIPIIINDFYEIYKVVMAVGIFLVVATTLVTSDDKHWGMRLLHALIVISALISLTQFFNLGGLNKYYIPYIAPTQYKALMKGYAWPRVVGLTGNPNRYSYMASIGALLGIILAFKYRRGRYIVSGLLCLTAMLMTRSRTGFLFFGVILIVWIYCYSRSRPALRWRWGSWLLVGLITTAGVGAFLYALLFLYPDSLTWRLKELFNLANSRSWQIRLRVWEEYFWLFMDRPLLGSGPSKAQPFRLPVDNEWLYLVKRYGLIGTAYFVAAFWIPISRTMRALLKDPAGPLYLAVLVGSAVFMIPAGVFHAFQGMALLMLTAGMAMGGLAAGRGNWH